jgi:hypothetical protein
MKLTVVFCNFVKASTKTARTANNRVSVYVKSIAHNHEKTEHKDYFWWQNFLVLRFGSKAVGLTFIMPILLSQ